MSLSDSSTARAPGSDNRAYWHANLRAIFVLLTIWFTVSFGFGILLVEWLNQFAIFGFKLGFWWAQQGSIFVFVVLIFVYTGWMHRIDRQFGVTDDEGA
tara:strand:+ start:235 stop:531 length:297 start_codon:yes stop_codon:yes gene_type:complete